ncbi:hypothetical protein ACS0PU_008595 [Formica fusca]
MQIILINNNLVGPHPWNLSPTEIASILFAGLIVWSAPGGISYKMVIVRRLNKHVLVMEGSDRIGTLAIPA